MPTAGAECFWTAVPKRGLYSKDANGNVTVSIGAVFTAKPAHLSGVEKEWAEQWLECLKEWPNTLKRLEAFEVRFHSYGQGDKADCSSFVELGHYQPVFTRGKVECDCNPALWSAYMQGAFDSVARDSGRSLRAPSAFKVLPTTSYEMRTISKACQVLLMNSISADLVRAVTGNTCQVEAAQLDSDALFDGLQWGRTNWRGESLAKPPPFVLGSPVPRSVASDSANPLVSRNLYRLSDSPKEALHDGVREFIEGSVEGKNLRDDIKGEAQADELRRQAAEFGKAFLDHAVFHSRVSNAWRDAWTSEHVGESTTAEQCEGSRATVFQRISQARNHPTLLSALGLLFEFNLTIPAYLLRTLMYPRERETGIGISLWPIWDGPTLVPIYPPQTLITLTETPANGKEPTQVVWGAKETAGSWTCNGWLTLGTNCNNHSDTQSDRFHAETMDIDGMAAKAVIHRNTIQRTVGPTFVTDSEGTPPASEFPSEYPADYQARALLSPSANKKDPFGLGRIVKNLPRKQFWATIHDLTFPVQGAEGPPARKVSGEALWGRSSDGTPELSGIRWTFGSSSDQASLEERDPPTPRSGGITLVRHRRKQDVDAAQSRAKCLQEARPRVLNADDLLLGFVPEIWTWNPYDPERDRTKREGRWVSLTRRHELIQIPATACQGEETNEAAPAIVDERICDGLLRLPTIQTLDGTAQQANDPPNDLHVPEVMFRWDGWSLGSTEPPPLPSAIYCDPAEERVRQDTTGPNSEFVKVSLRDDSIAPLSFWSGRVPDGAAQYYLRVRAVDLAGFSVNGASKFDEAHTVEVDYRRYEPVAPPEVLVEENPCEWSIPGRTLRTLVVGARDHKDSRYVVPPRTSLRIAELHGMFDADSIESVGGYDEVDLCADGSIAVVDARKCSVKDTSTPSPDDTSSRASYPIRRPPCESQELLDELYYPDPLAVGLAYRFVDFTSRVISDWTEAADVSFYPRPLKWPHARGARIVLEAECQGTAPRILWHGLTRTLEVRLPPGVSGTLELASCLGRGKEGERHLNALALWNNHRRVRATASMENSKATECWMPEGFWASTVSAVTSGRKKQEEELRDEKHLELLACSGGIPLLTPPIRLECIHAVGTPLIAPLMVIPAAGANADVEWQEPDNVRAGVKVDVLTDGRNTSEVRILARWQDYVDDPTKDAPGQVQREIEVGALPVGTNRSYDSIRVSTEQLPEDPLESPGAGQIKVLRHEFPDTAYRPVFYRAESRPRLHTLLDTAGETKTSNEVRRIFRSAARPKMPCVAYVLPAWRWEQRREIDPASGRPQFRSARVGGGLSLFLDRPWHRSGFGEQLGVVLHPDAPTKCITGAAEEYFTRWGADPIRGALLRTDAPTTRNFGCASTMDLHLTDGPLENEPVTVALYDPEYCPERRLWKVDLFVRPVPADFAFLKMALVRYQPMSLDGKALSPVLRADFAQLVPDRTVLVTRSEDDSNTLIVKVFGLATLEPAAELIDHLRTQLSVEVFRPARVRGVDIGWVKESEENVTIDELTHSPSTEGDGLLWSGRLWWKRRLGRRRLVIREVEKFEFRLCGKSGPLEPEPACNDDKGRGLEQHECGVIEGRLLYADVLDL